MCHVATTGTKCMFMADVHVHKVCMCVCACVHACVHACVCACTKYGKQPTYLQSTMNWEVQQLTHSAIALSIEKCSINTNMLASGIHWT